VKHIVTLAEHLWILASVSMTNSGANADDRFAKRAYIMRNSPMREAIQGGDDELTLAALCTDDP
jgi:hypothetical protein